jgi:hypothetical protein
MQKKWSIAKALSSKKTCSVQHVSNTGLEDVPLFPLKYAIACIEIALFVCLSNSF